MTSTMTRTATGTITAVNVRHVASPLHADLATLRALHRMLSAEQAGEYADDLFHWIHRGYAAAIEFAFYDPATKVRRYALAYTISRDGSITRNDDPGGLAYHDLRDASFTIRITGTEAWTTADDGTRQAFYDDLGGRWTPATWSLRDGSGRWTTDHEHGHGALGAVRRVYHPG